MRVFSNILFFVAIINSSGVITSPVKDVAKTNNISINTVKKPTPKQNNLSLTSKSTNTPKSSGKWQVGRVSRKQYVIINMLWRKTKIFVETEATRTLNNSFHTVKNHKRNNNGQHVTLFNHNPFQESFHLAQPKPKYYSSTPSYIEFYYLDELDERIKHRDNNVKNNNKLVTKADVLDKMLNTGLSRSPFFLFRVNEATCKATTPNSISQNFARLPKSRKTTRYHTLKKSKKTKPSRKDNIHESRKTNDHSISGTKKNSSYTVSLSCSKFEKKMENNESYKTNHKDFLDILNKYTSSSETTTAVNDHIRFFDIYDNNIITPYILIEKDENKMINSNTIQNEKKVNLNEVDHLAKHDNKTRYVKKHVTQNKDHIKRYEFDNIATTIADQFSNPTIATASQSRLTRWSEFPFVALYVYEPTQVRCDSASISPHWLVASATCLNRHHKDIKAVGRSAFVAYCSGNWRHPGRIAYVKQSLIHPRFHPKDNSRRHLYNIGAIQVVNSMAETCNGWAPISLMSHQFIAASDGTKSTALGWGLDRYDTRYALTQLPKHLTLYEGLVYSDSCPGKTGYSKARRLDEGSVKNVYCLSLPPYTEEENDAVHGSILLIGGKLIALYMQEERRSQGNQSAQYTGIWHLIPWLLDVAREPDELDPFSLQM